MVSMRATGVQQRIIAQAFGATDSNVSIVLNHPDAEYLLSRLQAMKATRTSDIEVRLQALAGKAIGALEAVFEDDVEPEERRLAFKRTPAAFKVLDMNGYARRQPVEHKHEHSHRLEASPAELGELAAALRESRQIAVQEAHVVSSGPLAPVGPGGEPATSPSTALSGKADAGAPSISDSQDPAREGGQA